MKTTKKRNLVLLITAVAFIVGIAFTVYAYPPFEFGDTMGPKEYDAFAKKMSNDLKAEGKLPSDFRLVMKSLGPDMGGIITAIMDGDREAISKLSKRFGTPPFLIPETKMKFTPSPEDKVEWTTYGLEVHTLGYKLSEAAKDPKIEMKVLLWNFNAMLNNCLRCHDRFKK